MKSLTKSEIIKKIKQKKELSGLADQVISDLLEDYLTKYKISLNNISKSDFKIIIKEIRSKLRLLTGRFQKSQKNREILLQKNNIKELLKTHTSTGERLEFYPKLKKIIKSLKINSILDIACGLNPIAIANPSITYTACDIKEDELKLIQVYFNKNNIKGKTFVCDLKKNPNLPNADLCLLFKVLDILEVKNHALANSIIDKLNCKYLIISFPTKKLSGKPMNEPKRFWLEKLLKSKNLEFTIFFSDNEIFYLVEK